jgi:hypothetical protein
MAIRLGSAFGIVARPLMLYGETNVSDFAKSAERQTRKPSRVAARKLTAGSRLKITFKTASFSFRSECDCCFDFPSPVLRCVSAFPSVMLGESSVQIVSQPAVV